MQGRHRRRSRAAPAGRCCWDPGWDPDL